MQNLVSFKTVGHDPFIDFIKAYAIICVLIAHTLPAGLGKYIGSCLWLDMQVPLFVLIQSFHVLKRPSHFDVTKIIIRIIFPFLLAQAVIYILLHQFQDVSFSTMFDSIITGGGRGPGAYFPWIFIQLAIILPLMKPFLNRGNRTQQIIIAILFCESFEILFSFINLPDNIYRLLAIRYLFLVYLASIWVKEGIKINTRMNILSLLSLLSIVYFEYFSIDDEPLFFNTAWKFHRWPCYTYLAIWGGYLLNALYSKLHKVNLINSMCGLLAKASYEIFLIQMIVLDVWPKQSDNSFFFLIFKRLLIYIICIVGGYWFFLSYRRLTKLLVSKQ